MITIIIIREIGCQKGNQIAVIKIGATENGKNMQFPEKKKKDFVFVFEVFFVWENDGCGARKDRYIPISCSTLAPSSVSSRTQKIANPDYCYGASLLPFQGPSLPTSLKSALKNPTSNLPQKKMKRKATKGTKRVLNSSNLGDRPDMHMAGAIKSSSCFLLHWKLTGS